MAWGYRLLVFAESVDDLGRGLTRFDDIARLRQKPNDTHSGAVGLV